MAGAVATVLLAATLCVWGALCLTFWQGSWQLLYHPATAVARTPANVGLPFEAVDFAAAESGKPQLQGWWIPSASSGSRFTAIYLHGADGNIGGTVDALIPLHAAGVNILDFDYRGYGTSQFIHPSEESWREDAESAIEYLRDTRHIPTSSLILTGRGLGANLALEMAAAHPEIAGVVLDNPLACATSSRSSACAGPMGFRPASGELARPIAVVLSDTFARPAANQDRRLRESDSTQNAGLAQQLPGYRGELHLRALPLARRPLRQQAIPLKRNHAPARSLPRLTYRGMSRCMAFT
jgi:pimeloyl-ACP methyl ester carboxylesterase